MALEVAVLIPVYNNPSIEIYELLDELVDQTYKDFRVYLAVECGDDSENIHPEITDHLKFKYLDISIIKLFGRKGLGFALNRSVSQIKEEIIIRHDVGDGIYKHRIKRIVDAFDNDPCADLVYSNAIVIKNGQSSKSNCPNEIGKLKTSFAFSNGIIHPTVAFKKSTVLAIGNYNPSLSHCEDLDLWLRMIKKQCNFTFIETPLIEYHAPGANRCRENWKTNLRVRTRNIGSPTILGSLVGILAIAGFLMVPPQLAEYIYKVRR